MILTIALVLGTAGPAFAEPSIKVSSSSISFVEGVTDDLIAEASKQFGEKKDDITKATLNLRNVTDDMVAKACAAYPGVRMIELLNSPKLTSVASVAGLADITELTFQDLPKVKDLSPLSKNTKLARMGLTKVGFANADMKWVAPLTDLQGLSVDSAPASFKSLEGIEKLVKLRQFSLKRTVAPGSLGPQAHHRPEVPRRLGRARLQPGCPVVPRRPDEPGHPEDQGHLRPAPACRPDESQGGHRLGQCLLRGGHEDPDREGHQDSGTIGNRHPEGNSPPDTDHLEL